MLCSFFALDFASRSFSPKRCQSSSALSLQITIIQITAAHICYLVAEANFESYSDSARLCLIGADHWKFPRTYASPEAIQVLHHPFCSAHDLKVRSFSIWMSRVSN